MELIEFDEILPRWQTTVWHTTWEFCTKDDSLRLWHVYAVFEWVLAQVEVDKSWGDTDIGESQPDTGVLRSVLHEHNDDITLHVAQLVEVVWDSVGVLVRLLKRPLPALHQLEGELVRVSMNGLLEQARDGRVLLYALFYLSPHPEQDKQATGT